MVLQSFKEIIKNKAYQIDEKDRKIFEDGDLQSFFGLNAANDFIEFILYDVNNNQLPQEASQGDFIRYIPLNNNTINNYFIVKTGTIMQKNKLPAEYFIDAERLIKEAGYNNGIFKTQITLLSRRVGSYKLDDKLWIKEISPSRTEIKLLPLSTGVSKYADLKERYNVLVNDGDFRDDTSIFLNSFLEKVTSKEIDTAIRNKYGVAFYQNLVNEYGIRTFSLLAQDIENTFRQACKHEFSNRYSDVGDGKTYGLLKPTAPPVSLSKKEIVDSCYKILVQIINSKLLTPKVKELTTFDSGYDESLDAVTTALSRKISDTTFNTNSPTLNTIDMVKLSEIGFTVVNTNTTNTTTTTTRGPGGGGGGGSSVCYTYVNNSYDVWLGDYTDCDGNFVSGAQLASFASICAVRGTPFTRSGTNLIQSVACFPDGGNRGGGGSGNTTTEGPNGGGGGRGRGGGTGRGDGATERPDLL